VAVAVPTSDSAPAEPAGEILPATSKHAGGGGFRSHWDRSFSLPQSRLAAPDRRVPADRHGDPEPVRRQWSELHRPRQLQVDLLDHRDHRRAEEQRGVGGALPFLVTFFGLVFAVLTERIRWSTAFKTIVFMPLVFSATAAGLTWASIFFIDPHTGMVNAAIRVRQRDQPSRALPDRPGQRSDRVRPRCYGGAAGAVRLPGEQDGGEPGKHCSVGLIAIAPTILQANGAAPAVAHSRACQRSTEAMG